MQIDIDTFDIDITRLDEEWLMQPRMAHEVIDKYRASQAQLRRAKALFAKKEASVRLHIRRNPEKYELPVKTTEKMIDEVLQQQKRFQEAQADFFKAQDNVDRLHVNVESMETRKKALEHLVRLHGQDYFATPKITVGAEDKIKERMVRAKVKVKRKRDV